MWLFVARSWAWALPIRCSLSQFFTRLYLPHRKIKIWWLTHLCTSLRNAVRISSKNYFFFSLENYESEIILLSPPNFKTDFVHLQIHAQNYKDVFFSLSSDQFCSFWNSFKQIQTNYTTWFGYVTSYATKWIWKCLLNKVFGALNLVTADFTSIGILIVFRER